MKSETSPSSRRLGPLLTIGLAALVSLTLSSCVTTSTVQSRIAAQPEQYAALSDSHRALVDQERVKEGMSKEAVYLAWGTPDGIRESSSGGKQSETWLYESYKPVYSERVSIGYGGGYGYGRGGGYGCYPYDGYSSFGYGTDVQYQPFISSTVTFRGNRVQSWEQLR